MALLLGLIALNAPFWWLQSQFFLSRPWLNIDLLLPLAITMVSLPLATIVLVALWALDGAASNSVTFYFTSPLEFLRSVQFLSATRWSEFISWDRLPYGLPFALGSAIAFMVMRKLVRRPAPLGLALGLALILLGLDTANGSSMLSTRTVRLVSGNPVGSPTLKMLSRIYAERTQNIPLLKPAMGSTRNLIEIPTWVRSHPDGSVLMVIVESLGWHRDQGLRNWMLGRLATERILQQHTLIEGQVPFSGATTSGELRELCSLAGSYRALLSPNGPAAAKLCLPQQLAAMGWTTVGYHGFSRHMFERVNWWPVIGLHVTHFAEDLLKEDQLVCGGAFAGACDSQVLVQAVHAARASRTFSYALTLNSHLPLKAAPIPSELAVLCKKAEAGNDVCLLTATLGMALSALAHEISLPSGTRPLVVVVGDHAPPFGALLQRDQYSQTQVPAYVLLPK